MAATSTAATTAVEATGMVFTGVGEPHELHTVSIPDTSVLAPGEVLVQITLATICGSDLHTHGGHRSTPLPTILGHEGVGVIVAMGDAPAETEGTLAERSSLVVGQRVTWAVADSCFAPDCEFCCGAYALPEKCPKVFKYGHAVFTEDAPGLNGCYASHILLRRGTAIVGVPDTVSDKVAVPANCALATVVNAIDRLPLDSPGAVNSVLVQGAGLLGVYACALLTTLGVTHVFCADIDDKRLATIGDFGGIPLDGRTPLEHRQKQVADRTGSAQVDAVLEMAGVVQIVPEAFAFVRTGGSIVFVGLVHPNSDLGGIRAEQFIRKCLRVHGVHNYNGAHLQRAVKFLESTAEVFPYERLVSDPVALVDLEEGITQSRKREWCRVAVLP